ncbi:MAG: hypothetical protein ACFFBD_15555 [Candidatus Hodarchaeota archaeon]
MTFQSWKYDFWAKREINQKMNIRIILMSVSTIFLSFMAFWVIDGLLLLIIYFSSNATLALLFSSSLSS